MSLPRDTHGMTIAVISIDLVLPTHGRGIFEAGKLHESEHLDKHKSDPKFDHRLQPEDA